MRELTAKQKVLLLKWANENPDLMNSWQPVDNMETEDWERIEAISNTEILYSNCNGFLTDLELNIDPVTGKQVYSLPK
jgi:hypothetical protein